MRAMLRIGSAVAMAFITTAASAWTEPLRGSETRAALMSSLRTIVAMDLSPPVQFVVSDLRRDGNIAFGMFDPQRPGGGQIPWSDTGFAARGLSRDGFDNLGIQAFFEWIDGHWYVRDYAIGATDVWWYQSSLCDTYKRIIPEFC